MNSMLIQVRPRIALSCCAVLLTAVAKVEAGLASPASSWVKATEWVKTTELKTTELSTRSRSNGLFAGMSDSLLAVMSDEMSSNGLDNPLLQLAQAQEPAIAQITSIEVVPSGQGINIIVSTDGGEPLDSLVSTVDRSLVIDIPDAQLVNGAFIQENPIAGIARVEAIAPAANQVQVIVTGVEAPPTGAVLASQNGLTLSVESPVPIIVDEFEGLQIVVTAEKQPDDVQDIPISITTFTTEEIEDADITSFEQVAGATPNFTTYTPSRNFILYSVRGLSNFNFLSRDPVAFYIDDVPYDYTGFLDLDLIDLERIEVLRGPQATLYGRNAEAGVVNVVTRRPTEEPEYNVIAGFGNFDNLDLRASASGPIVEDELLFRVSGNFERRDGFLFNSETREGVDSESGGGARAQLLWTPSDNWEVTFSGAFNSYRDGTPPISRPDLGQDPDETDLNESGFNDLDTDSQSIRVAYETDSLRVTSITARRFSNQDFRNDSDGSSLDEFVQFADIDSTVLSQEFRVQSVNEDSRFSWLAGTYFEDRSFNVDREGLIFGVGAGGPFTSLTRAEIDENTYALFGQASYRPIEPLTLTAGLRYEIFDSKLDSLSNETIVGDTVTINAAFENERNDGTEWLPRFAVEYDITPGAMVYVSVARAYRAQGVNFRATLPEQLLFDEEKSWNYEIGARTSWFGDRLIANLSLFHNPINDYQVPATNADGFFGFVDNGDVTINGLELELRARPLQGLDLTAGFGWLDAEYTNYSDPILGDFSGNQLPYTPDYTFNIGAQYRAINGIFGRVEVQGFGKTFFDDANTLDQDPYALVNARVGYDFNDQHGLQLFVNNLFNFRPLTTKASFFGGTVITASYAAPRTFGFQYRARF
ncbi:MAG: TonB-dependent receptor [Cyanothece sp. SIO2G6]|nr:TonB-dependent receptor [Cyanothece sp. SIO2G6]